jgi:hypothetical protein
MAVLELLYATVSLFHDGRESFALLEGQFLCEGYKAGLIVV